MPSLNSTTTEADVNETQLHSVMPSTAGSPTTPRRGVVSADKERISSAQHADQGLLAEINELLAQMSPECDNMPLLYALCARLHTLLVAKPIKSGKAKSAILRSLFRLLDMRDARLLTKLAHIILLVCRLHHFCITMCPQTESQLAKSGPTLANACKLLFKISRDTSNDAILRDEGTACLSDNIKTASHAYFLTP